MFCNGLKFAVITAGIITLSVSCKNKPTEEVNVNTNNVDELYYSSSQFINDQWNTNKLQPFVVLRVINENGKSDSAYLQQDESLFKEFSTFFTAADIAKKEYLGKYNYTENFDQASGFAFLTYTAKEPDLFTQKVEISMDPYSSKIMAVYIETKDDGFFKTNSQKILYTLDKGIFIQEYSKTLFLDKKERKLAYLYKY